MTLRAVTQLPNIIFEGLMDSSLNISNPTRALDATAQSCIIT